MVKVSKIISNKTINSKSHKINKVVKNIARNTNYFNVSTLSKSLLCLGMLGAVSLKSCEPAPFVEEIPVIDDSIILNNKIDNVLEYLDILVEPNNSIKDVQSISFESVKGDQFFFKINDLKDSSITIKQIKFDSKLNREDSVLTILSSDNGVEVIKTTDSDTVNMKIVQDGELLKSLVLNNGEWVEDSVLKGYETYFIRQYNDGELVKYFNIKNNDVFPEDLYFENPEEIEDEVVFG